MKNLKTLYNTTFVPALERLNKERQGLVLKALPFVAGMLLLWAALGIKLGEFILAASILYGAVCSLIWDRFFFRPYVRRYQKQIIRPLVERALPGFDYHPERMIQKKRVFNSRMFGSWDSYYGENYFRGMVDGVSVEFSTVYITAKQGKSTVTVFDGIVLVLDFHKHFAGRTVLKGNDSFSALEKSLRSWLPFGIQVVNTSNDTFNNTYTTYADDRLEARYVLSESLMQRLVDLNSDAQSALQCETPSVAFFGTEMMIALPCRFSLLTPRIFTMRRYYEHFEHVAKTLQFLSHTTIDLAMNRRIWTKR